MTIETRELAPQELQALGPKRLLVCVRSIIREADGINAYEVIHPHGAELPPFTAGSHIDLYFRDGRVRQYSLCNDPRERHRYVFAVQREPAGRGGSLTIFEKMHVGRVLAISEPRNNFPIHEDATHHLMIAGGIGVTPMVAMIHALQARAARFTLHYCTRSPGRTAFREELYPWIARGAVILHHDGGDPSSGLRIGPLLREYTPGTHLYYCGPQSFMAAVKNASAHWPTGTTHSEYFAVPEWPNVAALNSEVSDSFILARSEQDGLAATGFQVKIASTGLVFDVPGDKSIIQVLRENGINVPTSCESGLCGTCKTRHLGGIPDHRDYILQDDEKEEFILLCCSRAKSALLVLDL